MKRKVWLLLLLAIHTLGYAQSKLTGRILTLQQPLAGVSVTLLPLNQFVSSDSLGYFTFQNLKAGSYTLKISMVGYQPHTHTVILDGINTQTISLQLTAQAELLNEIQVIGLSTIQAVRRSAYAVTAIDAGRYQNQSATATDLINQTPGVRVRQDGGLGSNTSIAINGISGKQVKVFLDGIPLEYFGRAMTLSVLPVSGIERIEVYKGVVPVSLGADALGGAINVVSTSHQQNQLAAQYSMGSFNTHRASLGTQQGTTDQRLSVGLSGFLNYSDNNYPVDVAIPDQYGTPVPQRVRRFHDRFYNYRLQTSLTLRTRWWADEFTAVAYSSGLSRQVQHGVQMAVPFGAIHAGERNWGLSLKQEKTLSSRLTMQAFGAFSHMSATFTDTTLANYNWYGQVTPTRRAFGGESSASRNLLTSHEKAAIFRLNLVYKPRATQTLTLNNLNTFQTSRGNDPLAAAYYQTDLFSLPTRHIKNVVGLSFEQTFLDNRLTSTTAGKFFAFKYAGYFLTGGAETIASQQLRLGWNQALKWDITRKWLLKASYEQATRMPDANELFGFVNIIRPNPTLVPERSRNLNLSGQYNGAKLRLESTAFYRRTQDMIFLQSSPYFAQYQNLLTAQFVGLEADVHYFFSKKLSAGANVTYQDIRNRSDPEQLGTVSNRYYKARLPNIPYLFGNAELRYGSSTSRWQAWYEAGYVQAFFLNWSIDARQDTKAIIPTQMAHHLGLVRNLPKLHLHLTLECRNLFNQKLFDNFSVQKPGRSFSIQLRYTPN